MLTSGQGNCQKPENPRNLSNPRTDVEQRYGQKCHRPRPPITEQRKAAAVAIVRKQAGKQVLLLILGFGSSGLRDRLREIANYGMV